MARLGREAQLGRVVEALVPVDRPRLEVAAVQHLAPRRCLFDHRARLSGHRRRQHEQACGERRARRCRDERVDLGLADSTFDVRFGLDRAQSSACLGGLLGDEVDADIGPIAMGLAVGPFHPAPNVLEAPGTIEVRVPCQSSLHQPLERAAAGLRRVITLAEHCQEIGLLRR